MKVPTIAESVERMKREINEDIAAGRVPSDVKFFSELHDHVDANEYGGFCEDALFDAMLEHYGGRDADDAMPNGMLDHINAAQDAIEIWLRNGRRD